MEAYGGVRHGRLGWAWFGAVCSGEVWQAWQGSAGFGQARSGLVWQVRSDRVWRGLDG